MAEYYLDPAATGADDGTSWTDAWTTMQRAADGTDGTKPAAGDTVYCRGSENASATINMSNIGSISARCSFIGTNSSGIVDGTRYIIDWGSTTADGLALNNADYITLANLELISSEGSATYDGITFVTSNTGLAEFSNIYAHGWRRGVDQSGTYFSTSRYFGCKFSGNQVGLYMGGTESVTYVFCDFSDNTSYGFHSIASTPVFYGCTFIGNGDSAIVTDDVIYLFNCLIDGNSDAIEVGRAVIVGCRFTNNTGGINNISGVTFVGGSYFGGNGTDFEDTAIHEVLLDGVNTFNTLGGTDIDQGYIDSSSGNFNLSLSATLRSQPIELP